MRHPLAAQFERSDEQAAGDDPSDGGHEQRWNRLERDADPRYVVPPIRQTAIQARYGRELWSVCGSAIVRIV